MATVNLDTSVRLDIVCRKNDSFLLELDFGTEMPDHTNNTYNFKFATSDTATPDAGGSDFTVTVANNSAGETNALVKLECSASNMDHDSGLYVYDLSVTDTEATRYPNEGGAAAVKTLIYGTLKIVDDLGV